MRRLLALLALALPLPAAAFDIDALMRELARNPGGRARFVETKTIALLDRPVVSSGELRFTPPARLEKRTLKPKAELFILDGDRLSLERGRHKLSLRLGDQPEAQAFIDSLRGALTGDRAALERSYALRLSGGAERWTLVLLASDPAVAAFVQRIAFSGRQGQIDAIEYLQADGDKALMQIEPLEER